MELGISKLRYHTSMVLDTCKLIYVSIHTKENLSFMLLQYNIGR